MTTEDQDILISRVVDQEAGDDDWRALHVLAETDPGVWRELAQAQRDHAELSAAVDSAVGCADFVDLPTKDYSQSLTERVRVAVTWSGWIAAAAMVLAWGGVFEFGPSGGDVGDRQNAGVGTSISRESPKEALDYFMTEGREQGLVLGEPERLLLGYQQSGEGAKVVYSLQIVLSEDIQLFTHPYDELGRPDLSMAYPLVIKTPDNGNPE